MPTNEQRGHLGLSSSGGSNLVARQFNFDKAEYFELEDDAERAVPKVAF